MHLITSYYRYHTQLNSVAIFCWCFEDDGDDDNDVVVDDDDDDDDDDDNDDNGCVQLSFSMART